MHETREVKRSFRGEVESLAERAPARERAQRGRIHSIAERIRDEISDKRDGEFIEN